jgi:FAD-dependent urate hydroxylase
MKAILDRTPSPAPAAVDHCDAVVVGAGPYGLSVAAHLLERGLRVAVFGKTLELWRHRMPKGMLLRSQWWATNLSDPGKRYRFDGFLKNSRYGRGSYPMPVQSFIDYGLWFREQAVPAVDETYVSSVAREQDHFLVTLEDGRAVRTAAVVMAIGVHYYARRPSEFSRLAAELVSHSCEHNDFGCFNGRQVLVIGGGQSAIEYAALLHEAGASVHLVARRPVHWLDPDRANERTFLERAVAPNTGLAPGWDNWVLEHLPYLFHRFSQPRKDKYNGGYKPAATDWLRDRVKGKVTLHEGHTIVKLEETNGRVDAAISDGERVRVDHIILSTGYRVDLDKVPIIDRALRNGIKTDKGAPLLNPWFESSVPGLYFTGFTSLPAFGPLFRFVVGCDATARRVAISVMRASARRRSL